MRRVVVTGVGMVTPLGVGKAAFASALCSGRTGIGPITRFDARCFASKLAAQVDDFVPRDFIAAATLRRMDRLSQMATASARMALSDAGIQVSTSNRDAIGVVLGTCFGGTDVAAQFGKVIFCDSPRHANPILVPNTVMNAPAGHVAVEMGLRGVNITVNHREVSAEGALAYGAETVARGRAEVILAGGGDLVSEFFFAVLNRFRLLSPLDDAAEGLRPFDRRRNGTVAGEGFGVLCLESRERALARGAAIYCEIAGWGMSSAPAPPAGWPADGHGAVLALDRALKAAGLAPQQIDVVSAAAAGGPELDRLEAEALLQVFAPPCRPWIIALKGVLGENFASGGLRAAAMAMAIKTGCLPPIAGLQDPLAPLNFVRTSRQALVLRHAVVNGMASGGTFIALVLTTPELEAPHEHR